LYLSLSVWIPISSCMSVFPKKTFYAEIFFIHRSVPQIRLSTTRPCKYSCSEQCCGAASFSLLEPDRMKCLILEFCTKYVIGKGSDPKAEAALFFRPGAGAAIKMIRLHTTGRDYCRIIYCTCTFLLHQIYATNCLDILCVTDSTVASNLCDYHCSRSMQMRHPRVVRPLPSYGTCWFLAARE
jgi:hypothetical protein